MQINLMESQASEARPEKGQLVYCRSCQHRYRRIGKGISAAIVAYESVGTPLPSIKIAQPPDKWWKGSSQP